jgi:hypothetical protein
VKRSIEQEAKRIYRGGAEDAEKKREEKRVKSEY